MKLTAAQVYDALVNEDKILTLEGQISFHLGDVDIIVKQRDVVGNIIQEWLEGWLIKRGIEYDTNDNTQMPPDFYLDKRNHTKELLEVKAFNADATPAFDIADFRMYEEEIVDKPYMLHVDYLIFAYKMSDKGIVTIKNVWLKKVWEITRRMQDWPVNLQIKQNVVHKIRPGLFYKANGTPMFRCMEDFVAAIEQTVYQNPKTREEAGHWLSDFKKSYEEFYHIRPNIPRWMDIEDTYPYRR